MEEQDLFQQVFDAVQDAYLGMGYHPMQFLAEEALEDIRLAALRDALSLEGRWYAQATPDDKEHFCREWRCMCEAGDWA